MNAFTFLTYMPNNGEHGRFYAAWILPNTLIIRKSQRLYLFVDAVSLDGT